MDKVPTDNKKVVAEKKSLLYRPEDVGVVRTVPLDKVRIIGAYQVTGKGWNR